MSKCIEIKIILSTLLFFFTWVKWSCSTLDSEVKLQWHRLRYFFTPGLRLDAFLYMMPSRKPCRLSSGGQLLDSTDMSPCVLCFNSWSHRSSPKLPRRRTHGILMRSSQHRPSLSHLLDKVAPLFFLYISNIINEYLLCRCAQLSPFEYVVSCPVCIMRKLQSLRRYRKWSINVTKGSI